MGRWRMENSFVSSSTSPGTPGQPIPAANQITHPLENVILINPSIQCERLELLECGWMISCLHPLLHTSELATYKWIHFARMDVQNLSLRFMADEAVRRIRAPRPASCWCDLSLFFPKVYGVLLRPFRRFTSKDNLRKFTLLVQVER